MLPRELLRKIRKIEIVTARLVRDRLAGQYHSVFKGRGMAFSEVRQYIARRRHPRHRLERVGAHERAVRQAVRRGARDDRASCWSTCRRSGRFGSREQEKRELAAEIAAMVAFSAIKNNDRVGLIIFTDEVERFVPPKKGKKHVLRVISEILSFEPQSPRTDLAAGLEFLGHVARRKSVAFLVSDFLRRCKLRTRAAHRRPPARSGPGVVADPLEEALPHGRARSSSTIRDRRGGACSTPRAPRRGVRARGARAGREAREALFRRLSLDAIAVSTDRPYLPALTTFFEARARRLRH